MSTYIFDLDGTLLNTLDDLCSSVNYALEQHHMPPRNKEEVRKFLGNGAAKLIELSVADGSSVATTEAVLATFRAHYFAHAMDNTCPYNGVMDMLKQLKLSGSKIAIVSNKPNDAVQELHERFFREFVDVAIGEQEGISRKPAPDMIVMALNSLKAAKEKAIYVGDSEVDIQTANNSGLECISVSWGFRDKEYLMTHGAKKVIDSPLELCRVC